ncbi:MAG: hypothetical protein HC793_04880 [Aquincola sp.]|nr:hypothetical protein [Aquincola sp.]
MAMHTLRCMDPRTVIASRIDLQLRRHLGQPVDTHRALHDARYVKDLLLVCDAMDGTDLPQLANQFRTIDEQTSAARRVLSPRAATRQPMPYVPTGLVAGQRPQAEVVDNTLVDVLLNGQSTGISLAVPAATPAADQTFALGGGKTFTLNGGFVAGICFLLYFWSKHLGGTADWLEVLLFLAGVSCILLEMFVLPGAAIFGLGGGLLIIASLVLASQTFVVPHSQADMDRLRSSIAIVVGAGVGMEAAAASRPGCAPSSAPPRAGCRTPSTPTTAIPTTSATRSMTSSARRSSRRRRKSPSRGMPRRPGSAISAPTAIPGAGNIRS